MFKTVFCLFAIFPLFSEVVSIDSIAEVEGFVKDESVVFLDIDYTLTQPEEEAFRAHYYFDREFRKEIGKYAGHNLKDRWWTVSRLLVQEYGCVLIEEIAPKVVRALQERCPFVIGFTAADSTAFYREPRWRYNDLKALGIDFALSSQGLVPESYTFEGGILYSTARPKADTLREFLNVSGLKPAHIVMVDDRPYQIEPVEKFCSEMNIPFTGLLFQGYMSTEVRDIPKGELIQTYSELFERAERAIEDGVAKESHYEDVAKK